MSVGMVRFMTKVGVAVVGVGSAASCVGDVGWRRGLGGSGMRGLKVERL